MHTCPSAHERCTWKTLDRWRKSNESNSARRRESASSSVKCFGSFIAVSPGPPTGPGGRPPGLFVTHAHRAGGRPFCFFARAGRVGGQFFDRAPVGVARFFEDFTESRTKNPNSNFNGLKGNLGMIEITVALLPVLCYIRRTIIASFQIKKIIQIECS